MKDLAGAADAEVSKDRAIRGPCSRSVPGKGQNTCLGYPPG